MVRLAAVTMTCVRDRETNLANYARSIAQARAADVDLLVFPEVSVHGYLMARPLVTDEDRHAQHAYFERVAEPVPGPSTAWLAELCRGSSLVVQAGIAERDGDRLYNTAVLVGADGVLGWSRKTHNGFEAPVFASGGDLATHHTAVGQVGTLICYDLAFPEVARSLTMQGAEILALSTAWPSAGDGEPCRYQRAYDLLTRSAAFCNGVVLVAANHVGRPGDKYWHYFGDSRIVAPTGDVIASGGAAPGLTIADVDVPSAIKEARSNWFFGLDMLADRRPELYEH